MKIMVALVRAGARFDRGKLIERDPALEATHTGTEATSDPTTKTPTASDQPVNNAA